MVGSFLPRLTIVAAISKTDVEAFCCLFLLVPLPIVKTNFSVG
jgi:hypothetical protein